METKPLKHYTCDLNGHMVHYTNHTEFLVQTGHGPKGEYKTRYKFVGELNRAVKWFNAINIGRGYKKRLVMPDRAMSPILVKQVSA